MIKAATQKLEEYTDQKFLTQTYAQYMDCFPNKQANDWWDGTREMPVSELWSMAREIDLMIGPVSAITEFNTYADDGVAILFPSSDYVVDTTGTYGRVALKLGGVWPTTILRRLNGIEIKFTVGMASSASDLPSAIKQAVLELTAHYYERRGDDKPVAIPMSVLALVDSFKRYKAGGHRVV